jgi:DnaJ-class molecular chaperone
VVAAPRGDQQPSALPPRTPGPLPETGSIEYVAPEQAAELAAMAASLDGQDYFHLLQLPLTANTGDIKRAFYRESRVYHPDRFFHLTDAAAKASIGAIYKRITEAYYVLRDDARRRKYVADLGGPERATKLRYSEASEVEQKAEQKKAAEDEFGSNPRSRQFFRTALGDIASGNWSAAERNLKMGLTWEPGNAKFKERLVEVQRKIEEQRKASGDSFRIK